MKMDEQKNSGMICTFVELKAIWLSYLQQHDYWTTEESDRHVEIEREREREREKQKHTHKKSHDHNLPRYH